MYQILEITSSYVFKAGVIVICFSALICLPLIFMKDPSGEPFATMNLGFTWAPGIHPEKNMISDACRLATLTNKPFTIQVGESQMTIQPGTDPDNMWKAYCDYLTEKEAKKADKLPDQI